MKIKSILFVFFCLLLFSSCKNKESKSASLDNITIGVMSSMDYLPLAVAQREFFFDEVGISVDIKKFYSANERDAAFQSGNIDGTVIDYTGAVLQKAGGISLKLTSQCNAPFYIVVSKNSDINELKQLQNKSVAISQNTVIDYFIDMALNSVGMAGNDINKIEINKIPIRYEMLINNKIDATGLPNPLALKAEKEGCKIIMSNEDINLSITGIMFREEVYNEKTETIKKMYAAYNKGVEYLQSHKVSDIKDILVQDLGFTDDLIEKVDLSGYTKAAVPLKEDIESVTNWLIGRGLINKDFDKSSLTDPDFFK